MTREELEQLAAGLLEHLPVEEADGLPQDDLVAAAALEAYIQRRDDGGPGDDLLGGIGDEALRAKVRRDIAVVRLIRECARFEPAAGQGPEGGADGSGEAAAG